MSHVVPWVSALAVIAGLAAEDAAPLPAPAVHEVAPAVARPVQSKPGADPVNVAGTQPGLTIEMAIALALRSNETTAISMERIRRAEATLDRARAAMLPQVVLGGTMSTSANNEIPHGGSAIEARTWGASASVAIINPAAWSGYAASRDILRAQQYDSLDMRRSLAYTTSDVFLTVLAAEQQVVAAQRRLDVSRQSVTDAKARLQAGLSTRTDVTRAELTEAQSQLVLTQAARGVTASRLSLGDLMVREQVGPLVLPEPITVEEREIKPLLMTAIHARPDLQALRMRTSAAEQSSRAAYARYIPTISAQADASRTDSHAPAYAAVDDQTQVSVSLVASWTLYDGGDREGAIGQALADEREVSLTYTAQARGLRKDVLTAIADLDTAEVALAQAEASNRLARANADQVRARYKQGLATALEDADAISGQFTAESVLVASRLDLARSKLALRKLVGCWPLTNTEPVMAP